MTAPAAASAAPYTCEASAVRASLLGQAPAEPVVANRGRACTTAKAGGTDVVPALVDAGALTAATTLTNPTSPQRDQAAVATGGIAGLRVAPLPELGLGPVLKQVLDPIRAQVVSQLPDALAVPVPAQTIPAVTIPNPLGGAPIVVTPATTIPATTITVDVRAAALAALAALEALPTAELLGLEAATSTVAARCANGVATPVGASRVAGLEVLGVDLPVLDQVVQRALTLLGTQSVDPSTLTNTLLADYSSPLGSIPVSVVGPLLQPLLDLLPTVEVPAQVAQVKVTPPQQERSGGTLTQRALRVEIAALGRQVLDMTVGEARVGAEGIDCAAPRGEVLAATASDLALACTARRLVLVDVVPSGDRVALFGAADRRLAGRTVDIVFEGTGRRVARAKVGRDGAFRTTAALPSRRLRSTNRARYRAVLGRERSLNLKLERRMRVTSMTARDGRVRIRGRVSLPLANPVQPIVVRRRVSCRRTEVVKRIKPRRDGRFDVTVDAPDGVAAAVYRLTTSVRKTTRNPKRYPTFTLPRGVNLLR